MLPKTWDEFAIWVLVQFPVLAASFLIARYAVRVTGRQYQVTLTEVKRAYAELLAEREKRVGERDTRIKQLEAERDELKSRLSRTRKPPEGEKE